MDHQSRADALISAWRALADQDKNTEGWSTIRLTTDVPCPVLAGRRFPGREEAVVIGFRSAGFLTRNNLPQGRGFSVTQVSGLPDSGRVWIALLRQPYGSFDVFTMMADDIICILANHSQSKDEELINLFFGRIGAWQSFMQKEGDAILTPSAEIGLIGELSVLHSLVLAGVDQSVVLDGWRGPYDGLHDFVLGIGAIEVKATLAETGFEAVIDCLDQLDCSLVRPLFLAAVRLHLSALGKTLPEIVAVIREALHLKGAASGKFDDLLIRAGYFDRMVSRYARKFIHVNTSLRSVDQDFPKLVRGNVSSKIKDARYILNLDNPEIPFISLSSALEHLEVI